MSKKLPQFDPAIRWYKTSEAKLWFEWLNMYYGYGEPLSRP